MRRISGDGGANRAARFYRSIQFRVKSDRLLGLVLLTVGGQMVAATENALINTLEAPLAIAWVWLTFGEAPSATSLCGGIVVMTAVAVHVWHGSRLRLRPAVTYTSG